MTVDGFGIRIKFVCPEHGAHSVVDLFGNKRRPPKAKL